MRTHPRSLKWILPVLLVSGACSTGAEPSAAPTPPVATDAPIPAATEAFPIGAFAEISEEPVSDEMAAEFQAILNDMAGDAGMTATLLSSGAHGVERRARRTAFGRFRSMINSPSPASPSRWSRPR